jgi:hypothetical protein
MDERPPDPRQAAIQRCLGRLVRHGSERALDTAKSNFSMLDACARLGQVTVQYRQAGIPTR